MTKKPTLSMQDIPSYATKKKEKKKNLSISDKHIPNKMHMIRLPSDQRGISLNIYYFLSALYLRV